MAQNYEKWVEYHVKSLILQYGFGRKVQNTQQFVGAESG